MTLFYDPTVRPLTIAVLAEFFQDSFKDDPHGVSDWLAQGGTSVDLFVELVDALKRDARHEARQAEAETQSCHGNEEVRQ
jgi:hypothetical protein